MTWDQDSHQEYALALLEGCDEAEAVRRGRRGSNEAHSRRCHWVSQKPTIMYASIFDWTNQDPHSLTVDRRDSAQIEDADDNIGDIGRLLDLVTPRQREVLEVRYGLLDGERKTYKRTAELVGLSCPEHAWNREQAALARIRRELARPPVSEIEEARRLRKREMNRLWMQKRRSEAKAAS